MEEESSEQKEYSIVGIIAMLYFFYAIIYGPFLSLYMIMAMSMLGLSMLGSSSEEDDILKLVIGAFLWPIGGFLLAINYIPDDD